MQENLNKGTKITSQDKIINVSSTNSSKEITNIKQEATLKIAI